METRRRRPLPSIALGVSLFGALLLGSGMAPARANADVRISNL